MTRNQRSFFVACVFLAAFAMTACGGGGSAGPGSGGASGGSSATWSDDTPAEGYTVRQAFADMPKEQAAKYGITFKD